MSDVFVVIVVCVAFLVAAMVTLLPTLTNTQKRMKEHVSRPRKIVGVLWEMVAWLGWVAVLIWAGFLVANKFL